MHANGRSIWTRACDEAYRQGTIVCVAAGNPDPSFPESIVVPGDAKTAVTVGAIDKARQLARFSAMGSDRLDSPLYGKRRKARRTRLVLLAAGRTRDTAVSRRSQARRSELQQRAGWLAGRTWAERASPSQRASR